MTLSTNVIRGDKALADTLKNSFRKYPGDTDPRYRDGALFPDFQPSFTIGEGDAVFTIGSCFARNVEEALLARGMHVPAAAFSAPAGEAPGRPNRVLNQYNPGTMLQCITAISEGVPQGGLYQVGSDQWLDSLLATGSRPVTLARATERRQQIVELYRNGLAGADTVIITLGLVEAWYDRVAALYLNDAPPPKLIRAEPERFELRQMGVSEAAELVTRLVAELRSDRQRRIVLTVSPVPLQVTFAGGDATTANAYSKAVLRVVAQEVASTHDRVDYFPSYESVATAGFRALGQDHVHVRPVMVEKIVGHMLSRYFVSRDRGDGHGAYVASAVG